MKPANYRGRFRRDGFTLIEALVIIVIIVVVVVMLLPAFRSGPRRSPGVQCMSNLKQIALGYHLWRMDNEEVFPWEVAVADGGTLDFAEQGQALPHFQAISDYLKQSERLTCPSDEERAPVTTYAELTAKNLSYFVNATSNTNWISAILSGDRHVALDGQQVGPGLAQITADDKVSWAPGFHGNDTTTAGGNLAFLDGHVEFSRENLQTLFQRSRVATNRLVIP